MGLVFGADHIAARTQSRPAPSDERIRTLVVDTLQQHRLRRGNNPAVAVENAAVTLSGEVRSLWEKNEAIKLALQVEGVQRLVSDLTIARAESDQRISDELTERVLHYARFGIFDDLSSNVRNGVVRLEGLVTSPTKATDIADLASRIQGVQAVQNEIKPLPVSQSDDALRYTLASQIFQNPDLAIYAGQANPPIHIIVMNGRVTLKGFAPSALVKQQVEFIVRSTPGVLKFESQLQATRR